MSDPRFDEIMNMTEADLRTEMESRAVKYREIGNYEMAKLTDDCLDLLERCREMSGEQRYENIRDIWRRMREMVLERGGGDIGIP